MYKSFPSGATQDVRDLLILVYLVGRREMTIVMRGGEDKGVAGERRGTAHGVSSLWDSLAMRMATPDLRAGLISVAPEEACFS